MDLLRLRRSLLVVVSVVALVGPFAPRPAVAEVACWSYLVQADVQAVLAALPNDPYQLDQGRVTRQDGEVDDGDFQAGNGQPCDRMPAGAAAPDRPQTGDLASGGPVVGRKTLPAGTQEATIVRTERVDHIGVRFGNGDEKTVVVVGIATPETVGDQTPPQCYAAEATARLQKLLPAGRTVYLETDPHAATGQELHRHVWLKNAKDGTYRLLSQWLVAGGFAIVATDRLGTALSDVATNPPYDSRYRDELRRAESDAIAKKAGLWGACSGQAQPTAIPTTAADATAPFASGGLGLSKADWEAQHGPGTPGANSLILDYEFYPDGSWKYEVTFIYGDNVDGISFQLPGDQSMRLDDARSLSRTLMPSDATLVQTYTGRDGTPVDLYHSDSLAGRFTDTGQLAADPWVNGQPGDFFVSYVMLAPDQPVGGFTMGLGNNP
jgi:endonuclease YncB( thermonuclease family)